MKKTLNKFVEKVLSREFLVLVAGVVLLVNGAIDLQEFYSITGVGIAVTNLKKVVEKIEPKKD